MVASKESAAPNNVVRISMQQNAAFYTRAATDFLHGVKGKDDSAKPIYDEVVLCALGAAIPSCATVLALLEKRGVATLTKTQTGYAKIDYGSRPQLLVTVKRSPDYVRPEPKGKKGALQTPPCPERLQTEKLEKKMKKVLKEGGKRGVEIEGAADMGGLKYFCTKVLEPAGDLDMLVESVKAMNAKCDPSEEERKGGSGNIGKTVLSMADDDNLCICCYVPEMEQSDCNAKDWLFAIVERLGAKSANLREDSSSFYAQICISNDGEKGIFAIKMRDYVIQHANAWLREKGLLPDVEDESDDDMVFGDDDFP
ncbi:unnamed protein product [Amoebophrya sp. A25]|nr:unnamed protein product [Amoebophrya sp. A25]|eukprot:GSA25T00009855001.1